MGFNCEHGKYLGLGCQACARESLIRLEANKCGQRAGIKKSIALIKKHLNDEYFYSGGPMPVRRRDVLEEVVKELESLLD